MNNYKLYLHTTPNGKRYYGITKQNPKKRWLSGHGYRNNQYFWRAITKYGWNNITHEVLCDGLTEHEAQELEQYMIQWYDTANRKYGYNLSKGGESSSGYHHTEETKQKMSESMKGKYCGENNPMYGVHRYGKNNPAANSIICLTTKRIFFTTKEAGEYYNIDRSHIVNCCKGKRKSAGKLPDGTKLVWKYVNYKHNKTYRIKKGA